MPTLTLLLIAIATLFLGDVAATLEEADRLALEHRDDEALALYLEVLDSEPENFRALTEAAYLLGEVGKRFADMEKKESYYDRSLKLAREAYRLRPDHARSNFAMAWALGGRASLSGARERVRVAQEMKGYLDSTLQKDPANHRAWYILANWRYQIATANFVERAAARLLAGGLPEGVTLDTALDAYGKAVELAPESILYRYELAVALREAGLAQEAADQLRTALNLEARSADDPRLLLRCRVLLNKIS